MRRIAIAAGVSVMTVSRALRDSPLVTSALRTRVKKIAAKLGYRPDPELAKLMKHLRRHHKPTYVATLAAITSVEDGKEPLELKKSLRNARARAEELGYRLEVFRTKTPTEFNRQLERTLVTRGIEGVLLMQMTFPSDVGPLLDWTKFSVVAASPSILNHAFPQVGVNYFHNAQLLCSQLARKGCRRIGFAASETFCVRTSHAFSAAAAWQNLQNGTAPVPPLVVSSRLPSPAEIVGWIKREKPDAVIAHSTEAVSLISGQLASFGARRPILACSNVDPAATNFSGIDERHEIIGRNAVELLTGLISRAEKSARTLAFSTLIAGRWVEAP